MILVVLPEGGCWRTLGTLWKYRVDTSHTEHGGRGRRGDGRRQTDYQPASCERVTQSLIAGDTNDLKCLGFHSVKAREVGAAAHRGEQYSIRLWTKALFVVRSSGVPRKDFARWRMPRLAFEASLKMWLSQERSWKIVRPRSLNERTSSCGLLRK